MKNLLSYLAITAAAFFIVEGFCRTIWTDNDSIWMSAYRPPVSPAYLDLALIQEGPTGRRLTPNLNLLATSRHTRNSTYSLRTNSLGIRGAELDPSHSRPRILFIGDSVTWNDYLSEEETFTVLLQNKLENRVEVLNAAIGATGIDNYLNLLLDIGPKVKPDTIIIALYLNDAAPSLAHHVYHLPSPFNRSKYLSLLMEQFSRFRYLRSDEYLHLIRQTMPLTTDIDKNFKSYDASISDTSCIRDFENAFITAKLDWGLGWSNTGWQTISNKLSEIKAWTDLHHSRLAVLLFPVSYQLCDNNQAYPSLKFKTMAEQLGILYLDLLPPLKKLNASDIYIDHCHFSVQGNKVVADELQTFIQTNNL